LPSARGLQGHPRPISQTLRVQFLPECSTCGRACSVGRLHQYESPVSNHSRGRSLAGPGQVCYPRLPCFSGIVDQVLQYQTRPAKQEDEPFLYACYRQTMRKYVERTWGWNEEFQRASFVEHLPWQRFQIIAIGPIAVGGACILESPTCSDLLSTRAVQPIVVPGEHGSIGL
jgi:hypothetical protein